MQKKEIIEEAWRNFKSGTSKPVIFGLAFVVIVAVSIIVQNSALLAVINQADEYKLSGGSVSIVAAGDKINPAICDSLSIANGVQSAGAIVQSTEVLTPFTLPQSSVPVSYVSEGFSRLLDITAESKETAGIYISQTIADRLGASAGDTITLTDLSIAKIRGVYAVPDDGRKGGLGYAALIPQELASANECWADIWPQKEELRNLLLMSVMDSRVENPGITSVGGPPDPEISQLNSTQGIAFTEYQKYSNSLVIFTPLICMLIAFLISFLAVWLRRLEFSSALHSGMQKRDLLKITLFETLPPIIAAAAVSIPVMLSQSLSTGDYMPFIVNGIEIAIAGCFGYAAGASLGAITANAKNLFRNSKAL